MSSDPLPNSVCKPSRTPSGNPLMDVTIPNRSSFKWVRSSPGSAPVGAAWLARRSAECEGGLPATIADQRLKPITRESVFVADRQSLRPLEELLVFQADFVDQLCIDDDALS